MTIRATEQLHPMAQGLDARATDDLLAILLDAQESALASVRPALPSLSEGARLIAECLRSGGRLCYAGAGSSALMANADGMELPGTYGIDPDRIVLCMAGGIPTDANMPGDTEDDVEAGRDQGNRLRRGDLVVAVTASGATPYTVALAAAARDRGARVVAIANTAHAPIFALADAAILLSTPPEVIAGSTRMGAGTAQKAALNMMSTLAAVLLGRVHDGMMVGLKADNSKLRARAAAMVSQIASVSGAHAEAALDVAGGDVKLAVLIATGAEPDDAARLLAESDSILRAALARLKKPALAAGND